MADLRHSRLSFDDAETALQLYGRVLLDHAPERTSSLITMLCIDYQQLQEDELPKAPASSPVSPQPLSLRDRIRYSLRSRKSIKESASVTTAAPALLATLGEGVMNPLYGDPSQYIPLFIGHTELLKQFLEQVVQRSQTCDNSTWTTLLELQLREEKAVTTETERAAAHKKVMATLTSPRANYDREEALVLVQSYDSKEGQLYLYKEMHMYSLLLQHYLAMKDIDAVIALCESNDNQKENLWIELLMVIARDDSIDLSLLEQLLSYIEKHQVLPILYALQILSQNEHVEVGMVKRFIQHALQKERGIVQSVSVGV